MEDIESVRSIFQSSELFKDTDPAIVRGLFSKNFHRGDPVREIQNGIECVGIVASGSLSVSASQNSSVSVMKRGGEFGICNIFVSEGMPTDLKARTMSKVLFLPKEEFARLLSVDSALMYRYVKLCNEKMLYLAERLRLISIRDSTERLLNFIESLAVNGVYKLSMPKDELARQLGISRASLFRSLSALEISGKITIGTGIITVTSENISQ